MMPAVPGSIHPRLNDAWERWLSSLSTHRPYPPKLRKTVTVFHIHEEAACNFRKRSGTKLRSVASRTARMI
jgi:hypothetical protein